MKIILEPTDKRGRMTINGERMFVRLWTGFDDRQVPVHAYIATVSPQTHDADVAARFLAALGKDLIPVSQAFDLRFFID